MEGMKRCARTMAVGARQYLYVHLSDMMKADGDKHTAGKMVKRRFPDIPETGASPFRHQRVVNAHTL